MSRSTRLWLWLEFSLLFGGAPLLILLFKSRLLAACLLWGGALAAYACLRLTHGYRAREDWNSTAFRTGWRPVLLYFCALAPVLIAFAFLMQRPAFFSLPLHRPQLWLMIMVLYPLLSVWPQEMLYRSFMFRRYAPLFGQGIGFDAASALAFAFLHVVLLNAWAVLITLVGGILFARTYRLHRSLALVSYEHALYGCLIFTVGLGRYFFTGAAWH